MTTNLKFVKTFIQDLFIIERKVISDARGEFSRLYCAHEYEKFLRSSIKQSNFSLTNKKGTVRGLHYQTSPYAEDKVIICVQGKIYDVVVDLRKNSKTFLKWYGIELNHKTNNSILIPKGCAHGFQSLTNNVNLLYFHTNFYNKIYEQGVNPLDKKINIKWPLEVKNISEKDKNYSFLKNDFEGL